MSYRPMECPACGNRNREGARFCDSCGFDAGARRRRARTPPAGAPVDGDPLAPRRRRPSGAPARSPAATRCAASSDAAGARTSTWHMTPSRPRGRRRPVRHRGPRRGGAGPRPARDAGDGEARRPPPPGHRPRHRRGRRAPLHRQPLHARRRRAAAARRQPDGRLEVDRAIAIGIDVCRALEHAHSCGIVHRDLKPANVWLAEDGGARLGDFGLAGTGGQATRRVHWSARSPTCRPSRPSGVPPARARDLYSLGALLYEMVAGQPPFTGGDAVSIIGRHLNADPVAPSRHNPAVPPALDELILRLLAKSPGDRPDSAASVREALEAVRDAPPEPAEAAVERGQPARGAGGPRLRRPRGGAERSCATPPTRRSPGAGGWC